MAELQEYQVKLPADADIHKVIELAGGDHNENRFDHQGGVWYIHAPSQKAVDDALQAYDHGAHQLTIARAARLAELSARRWEVETAGVTVLNRRFATSREARASMAGAVAALPAGGKRTKIDFKTLDGWCELTAAQMAQAWQAVNDHVQAAFTNERAIAGKIAAAKTAADVEAVDLEAGWPS